MWGGDWEWGWGCIAWHLNIACGLCVNGVGLLIEVGDERCLKSVKCKLQETGIVINPGS